MTDDRDREAFEAWFKTADRAVLDRYWAEEAWEAALTHARAQAGEPVAWVNESYRNEILERSGKVYWHAPMMCGQEFKGSFPVYLAVPAQEPVAVPAGSQQAIAEAITPRLYRCGDVGVSWDEAPDDVKASMLEVAAGIVEALAAAPSLPAESGDDDAEHCIACDEPFKDGDLVYPDVSGGHIHDECADDGGFATKDRPEPQVWPLASTPAPQPGEEEDCQKCAGNGEVVTDWDRYLKPRPGDVGDEAVAECPVCNGTGRMDAAPQPDHLADAGKMIDPQPGGAAFGVIDPDYARVFTQARAIAWQEGYAIMMHGSFTRDLDLLAVPWTDAACEPEHLVRRIEAATKLKNISREPSKKPHGRLAWTLMFPTFGDPRFVDFGVMPRALPLPTPPAGEG